MAGGKLGSAALAAATYTVVYTVPANKIATLNVAVVNRGGADAEVRVAITTEAATPAVADFIEFDAVVPGEGGILERTALVAGSGEKIMVRASTADVTVRVHGLVEDQ
jgi:Fe-S cluster assembly scaffold protein SufB